MDAGPPQDAVIVSTWDRGGWGTGTRVETPDRVRLARGGIWGERGDTIRVVPVRRWDVFDGWSYSWRPGVTP